MASISIRIRFTTIELAHGIDALVQKGHSMPPTMQDLIRQLTYLGIAYGQGNAMYGQSEPSLMAQNTIRQLESYRSNKHSLNQLQAKTQHEFISPTTVQHHNTVKDIPNTESIINTVDFDQPVEVVNLHLLQYLTDVDRRKGTNMLHAMMIPDGMTIIKALTNPETRDDDTTRRIAFEMFSHCDTLTKEEQEAIDNYKGDSHE